MKIETPGPESDGLESGLNEDRLAVENIRHADSGGVSAGNRDSGFVPAFMDRRTGEIIASCHADGRPAQVHLLDGLPEAWVESRRPEGDIERLKASVVSGFVRGGIFYTREAAARAVADDSV